MKIDIEKMNATEIWEYALNLERSKEYEKAAKCLQKASDMGELLATFNLAVYYENGIGVKQDFLKAAELYLMVAACREQLVFAGDTEPLTPQCDAEFALGRMCEAGILPNSSVETAIDWYTRAINDGCLDIDVYIKMAELYFSGQKVEKDYDKSANYVIGGFYECPCNYKVFNLAIKLADTETQHKLSIFNILAECYTKGLGTDIDLNKAEEFKEKADALQLEKEKEFEEIRKKLFDDITF